jgi:DNA-binding MarR family transcriptional regulator
MVENMSADRSFEPMELFLMAAISRAGVNSMYAFQRDAELQPGSISSIIGRLEQTGLLLRRGAEKRGLRPMVLTETGEDALNEDWRNCLDPRREMESVLRSTTVALLMGEVGTAIDFLFRSAAERAANPDREDSPPFFTSERPIDVHAEMRAVHEKQRRALEGTLLRDFAMHLSKLTHGPARLDH